MGLAVIMRFPWTQLLVVLCVVNISKQTEPETLQEVKNLILSRLDNLDANLSDMKDKMDNELSNLYSLLTSLSSRSFEKFTDIENHIDGLEVTLNNCLASRSFEKFTDIENQINGLEVNLNNSVKMIKKIFEVPAPKTVNTTTSAPTTTVAPITKDLDLLEVNFPTVGGTAKATSKWGTSDRWSAPKGFAQPGHTWHSSEATTFPQSIWYEFPQALRVVKYSFQSRTDGWQNEITNRGPTRYKFWGSNAFDCNNIEARVTLVEDTSGTPFTQENIPKVEDVENPDSYRCYGFTVYATGGNTHAAMSNIRFYYPRDLLEVNFPTVGGTAKATSKWGASDRWSAPKGFAQPGHTWHSSETTTFPQSIWYEFPQALRVAKYSFQSRTDGWHNEITNRGPTRYKFWGSNSLDCSNIEARVTLVEDTSGTPFTQENIPKVEDVENPDSYRCYGFTVYATGGNTHAAMSNIRLYYPRGLCLSPYKLRGTECFYVSEDKDGLLVWDEARQRCLSMGGDLAEPQDMVDFVNFIGESYPSYPSRHVHIWIGGTDKAVEQDWYWVSGKPVPPAMWKPWPGTQPDGDGDCMDIHSSVRMNDWWCHNKIHFACEFNMA